MTRAISNRHRLWLGIALVHLVLVIFGAAYVDLDRFGFLEPAISYYGALSGSSNSYGFFAPGIDSQLHAIFEVTDSRGRQRLVPLETGASAESDLRVGNIIDQFAPDRDDKESDVQLQRSLSASLARVLFMRIPDAKSVNVRLEEYRPVSMEDYRKNKRSYWAPLYSARYSLNARVARQ